MSRLRNRAARVAAASAVVVAAVAVGFAAPAGAAVTQCVGTVTGEVDGDLIVPAGAACVLAGAQVHGNVIVSQGASLHAVAAGPVTTTIDKNVLGFDVQSVLLQYQTQVGGNFVIDGATGGVTGFDINVHVGGNAIVVRNAGYTFIDAAIVDQNVLVTGSTGGVEVEWNRVGGSEDVSWNVPTTMSVYGNQVARTLTVLHNTGGGHKQVIANNATRSLTCLGNDEPFVGGPNASSNVNGQCF